MSFRAFSWVDIFVTIVSQPLMRDAYEKNSNMSEAEARALLDRCMKVLFYRDARSFNKVIAP